MNVTAAIMLITGFTLLVWMIKRINAGSILLSAVLGMAALFAVDLVSNFTHLRFPVNGTTLLCAAIGGVPGVILMTVLTAMA